MKKLLLSSFVGLVLVGCGEKKVTEEMLIGEWDCTFSGQEAKWENGKFSDYAPLKQDKGMIRYFMKDNTLFFNFGTDTSYPYNLKAYYNDSMDIKSNNGVTSKTQKTMNYLSPDKFKTTELTEILIDNAPNANRKMNVEINCDRVKN